MSQPSLDALYPIVQALGWSLLHFFWQGALIAAIFAAGCLMLRRARPTTRYLFGLLNMVLMAAAPIVTFVLVYSGQGPEPSQTESVLALATVSNTNFVLSANPSAWIDFALPWIVLCWAIGVLLMSTRVLVNWRRMKRLTRVGVLQLSTQLQTEVEKLSQLFRIRTAVVVLESTIVKVPTVLGWLKPVILLPTSTLLGLSTGQLELVIAHELGHIRRLDYLVNLFQVVVETALFYHPGVGWVSRRIRDEREQCVDDLVIGRCGNPIEYAKALAELESMRAGYQIAPAIGATDGQLLQRIERIVCDHAARPREAFAGNSMLLLLLAGMVMMAGQLADPMAGFEAQRNQLADKLVSELVIGSSMIGDQAVIAPLDGARPLAEPVPLVVHRAPSVPRAATRDATDRPAEISVPPQRQMVPAIKDRIIPVRQSSTVEGIAKQESKLASAPSAQSVDTFKLAMVPRQPIEIAALNSRSSNEGSLQSMAPAAEGPVGPIVITRVSPSYPVRARMAGQQGYVVLEFDILDSGRVSEVRVIDSSPKRVFDDQARRTMRKWRFDSATRAQFGNKRFTQRFDFNLGGGQAVGEDSGKSCSPVTGTRICRTTSPTSLVSQDTYSS